ncbi:PREDICTED: uncharacterized protein LOC109167534 [Ipomoea nil]|uniref:uncharacterized protein LOC109167534 n=1 Tax=Ipomoea nil TaxID=35883 RepID=UPI0009010849|nr:PREDICTED: uncharacterized protein LOC109167534 [Ipomoea nil]
MPFWTTKKKTSADEFLFPSDDDDNHDYVPSEEVESSVNTSMHDMSSGRQTHDAAWYNDYTAYGNAFQTASSSIAVGMVFDSYRQLKNMVTQHNLDQHTQFKTAAKKSKYWKATCLYLEQCAWMISVVHILNAEGWIVKKFHNIHGCCVDYTQGGDDYNLTSKVISELILQKIVEDLRYKIKYVIEDVKAKWGVCVDYKKAWYAKVIVLETLYGKWDESYNILPQTLMAIQQTNPETVVDIVSTPTTIPNEFWFKYVFWAFKPAIEGFKYYLPVLTVDGTHLYRKYKGYLLLALSINANKEIHPVAYSIIDVETGDSWSWFLTLVAQHVFGDLKHICIISDRHGGIDVAFCELPELAEPRVQHRYCRRHLWSNLMTKFKNKELKKLFWQAGCAMDVRGFEAVMSLICANDEETYNYLMEIPARFWSLSHDGGFRHGLMTTNSSESFNNSLKRYRLLLVSAIVKLTNEKSALMFVERRTSGLVMQQGGLQWPRNIFDEMLKREGHKYRAIIKHHDDLDGIYLVAIEGDLNRHGK